MCKMNRRAFLAVTAASTLGTPFYITSGRAQDLPSWKETIAAAAREGSVQIYTTNDITIWQEAAGGFNAIYPDIEVVIARVSSGPMSVKVNQEMESGSDGADFILTTSVGYVAELAARGALLAPRGPHFASWPKDYILKGTGGFISGADPIVLAYNTNRVKNPPRNYTDLLRPEFKGRIANNEPGSGSTSVVLFDWLQKTYGQEFIEKFASQGIRFYPSSSGTHQAVASGEADVSSLGYPSFVDPLKQQGAPIDYVIPSPGLAAPSGMGAIATSRRPNAALLMLDYCMSPEGQSKLYRTGISPLKAPGTIPGDGITIYDPAPYTVDVLAERRKYWTQAMVAK